MADFVRVSVRHDLDRMITTLDDMQRRHIPYAKVVALTRTAGDVKKAEIQEISRSFDAPTPYTLNALFTKSATKTNPSAFVWLKDEAGKGTPADRFLAPEVYGGARVPKRFESALSSFGILPPGMFAMPGAAARLDRYGNMSSGQIVQILSQLRVQRVGGFESRIGGATFDKKKVARSVKRQGYRLFAITRRRGKLPPGVYARYTFGHGTAVKPLLVFVSKTPSYSKRFKFFEVAERVSRERYPVHFAQAMREASGGARL
jgi:hypothetical protein